MVTKKHYFKLGRMAAVSGAVLAGIWGLTPISAAAAKPRASTIEASVSSTGVVSDNGAQTDSPRAMSESGRYVVFASSSSNLVSGDINGLSDIFLHDQLAGTTMRVNVASDGTEAIGGGSDRASISADGRFVAFYSYATNLVANDTNGVGDVFVHDCLTGRTTRASVASNGDQADATSAAENAPQLSADGRYVVFESFADNLVPNDTNGTSDAFVHDTLTGATRRISASSQGAEANGLSSSPALSADGHYAAFISRATNLVPKDTNGAPDVFLRDMWTGSINRVSVTNCGGQSNGESVGPTLSADGRYVAFEFWGNNLTANDTNNAPDIFVRDTRTGTTTLVSRASDGTQGDNQSRYASISGDGRLVAFQSMASNFDTGDTNGDFDVFVKDLRTGALDRENVTPQGTHSGAAATQPSISQDGSYVAFNGGDDLVASGDSNNLFDVFVRRQTL